RTGGARQRGLLVELRRPTDETRERLEVPELQICGLAEEAVELRGELGEVDSRRAAVLSASAQGKRTSGLVSLPEPLHHALRLPFDRLRDRGPLLIPGRRTRLRVGLTRPAVG